MEIVSRGVMFGPAVWLLAACAVTAQEQAAPRVTVTVDPRVELMSVIFRLAGNPEYSQGKVPSYVQDVESHFGRFRDHAAVTLAKKLRETRGISFNAPMGLAVYATDAVSLRERIPLSPLPEALDSRWTPKTARDFLDLARQFAAETKFKDFFDQHESLYQTGVQRMQEMLDQHAHLEWFDNFFGPRKQASFHVVLGMLNGGPSYAASFRNPQGREEFYSIVGVWRVDARGQPAFSADAAYTFVHELTHSYTNPLVDQFAKKVRGPGETIFRFVGPEMRKQAYGSWEGLMYESLNRACGLRYLLATEGRDAMEKQALRENARSFYWVGELAEVLGEYDTQPRKYRDLAEFFPRIVAFFEDYAKNADTKLGAIKEKKEKQLQEMQEKGPKIVTMVPANGAQDVDPNLKAIVVTFDRPMRSPGWSVVTLGSQDQCPKSAGPVGYDDTRKVFTMPVALQPGREYFFGLNAEQYLGFQSQEGVTLAPVVVRFKTRGVDK